MIREMIIMNQELRIRNKRFSEGFTFIELIIVLSVTAIISVIGIVSFVSYNQTQSLNTAAEDIVSMFNLAKSRAASGVKPSTAPCSVETLNGYQISISIVNKTYRLDAVCSSGTSLILTSTLPNTDQISFSNPTDMTFFYAVLTGGFTKSNDTIDLTGFNKSKTITIDSLGNAR